MQSQLSQIAALNQKDKGAAYVALIPEIFSRPNPTSLAADLHSLIDTLVNQEHVGLVVSRHALSEVVKALGQQPGLDDLELRKRLVEDAISTIQPRVSSYEEQVSYRDYDVYCSHNRQINALRFQLADILEAEEEWTDAARVLMGISLDSGQRRVNTGYV